MSVTLRKKYKLRTTYKIGRGITTSKPKKVYPLLPESPTNRSVIKTNSENLVRVERGSNEYKKRSGLLLKLRKNLPKNIPPQENSYFKPNNVFKIKSKS